MISLSRNIHPVRTDLLTSIRLLCSWIKCASKAEHPSSTRSKTNQRFRNFETDIDSLKRKLKSLSSDRKALFGDRYTDNPSATDDQLEQRQQPLRHRQIGS
jgi:hypothetical protein